MLTAIEGRLEELFETVESLPADRVEQAEKVWEHTHTHTNTFCTILHLDPGLVCKLPPNQYHKQ